MHWQIIILVFLFPTILLGFIVYTLIEDWSYVLNQVIRITLAICQSFFWFIFVIGVLVVLSSGLVKFWTWVNNYLNIV
jgi:hypothetical protein